MLTSQMVQINVELPQSDSKTVAPTDLPIMMTADGKITVVGKPSSMENLEADIASAVRKTKNKDNATLNIVSEVGVPWEKVHKLISIASGLKLKAIIATQPTKG
jgi:biopolymer transport protein ExbD